MSTITETAQHFYGHGQSWLFNRTTGGAIAVGSADAISLPEVDSLEITVTNEKVQRTSKRNSLAAKNVSVVRMLGVTGKLVCSQHVAALLTAYLYGTNTTIAGGSVSGLAFTSGIAQNDIVAFPSDKVNFSTFTSIVDSAGSPATLVNGTDYYVDELAGVVKFLNVSGFTQPFKLNGTERAGNGIGLGMTRIAEKWLRHKAINILNNDAVEVVDLYRIQLDPASKWDLVNDGNDPNKYEISFEALIDTTKSASATFGQFGRLRQ